MICPSCGAIARAGSRFCDQCGQRLALAAGLAGGPVPADEAADRRIVTAVFADIVGYSRLVAELDPEDVRVTVDDTLARLVREVDRFGGSVEKFIGDAVFAVFGAPTAHDDDAVRGCLCALAMRDAVASIEGDPGRPPLQLRIGVATGEVVAGVRLIGSQRALSLVGEAVTIAARLQQTAEPGEILLEPATLAAAQARVVVEPAGERELRGTAGSVRTFRLLAAADSPLGRPVAGPLVGRDPERRHLRELLVAARDTGRGGALIVVGEAGLGKSRLLADLEADARRSGFAWTWAQNASYGSTQPYGLVRRVVDALAQEQGLDAGTVVRRLLFAGDLDPTTARRYAGAVAVLARDAAVAGWEQELEAFTLDPRQAAEALRATVARFAEQLGRERPRVVVMDDLHWADPSSLALLESFARACRDVPLVLLIGTRPQGAPAWADAAGAGQIELQGLDLEATRLLVSAMSGHEPDPESVQGLHERTAGNPLFLTEIVRASLGAADVRHASRERGAAVTDELDRAPATRSDRLGLTAPSGALPPGLRALLGARIDALDAGPRAVLGVASVVGMEFAESLVGVLVERDVVRDLDRLHAAGLVERATPVAWRFVHPLFQEAAYAAMLGSIRRRFHARLADRLEVDGAALEALAHHRAAAGDAERALPLLDRAASEALAVGAPVEAAGLWRRAAELAPAADREAYLARADAALELVPALAG